MIRLFLMIAAMAFASGVHAQAPAGSGCPAGTRYATIRHSVVMPGKWAMFEKAVADHQAWYARHGHGTTTTIIRMVAPRGRGATMSDAEAVTITRHADKAQPVHDADWDAFTAQYKASSTIKDEMRVCMPMA